MPPAGITGGEGQDIRMLGTWMDTTMRMETHVRKPIGKAYPKVGTLSEIIPQGNLYYRGSCLPRTESGATPDAARYRNAWTDVQMRPWHVAQGPTRHVSAQSLDRTFLRNKATSASCIL